ncbi:MAG: hypothetical protein J1E31_05670 [Helicobacter sp.]|nr:hypothetical protein [Helicobacter sp.]
MQKKFILFEILCVLLCLFGCKQENSQEATNQQENNVTTQEESLKEQDTQKTEEKDEPLKEELKRSLRKHLDNLSDELKAKDHQNTMLQNEGFKAHQKYLEDLEGNFKQESKAPQKQHFDNALELQKQRIEELQKVNEDIMK